MDKRSNLFHPFTLATVVFVLAIPILGAKHEINSNKSLIRYGLNDSVVTTIFVADSGSINQEVSVTNNRSGITYKIKQVATDSNCNYEISGSAHRMYNSKTGGGGMGVQPTYFRYLGRSNNCIVDIKKGKKWVTFSTSNCVHGKNCLTSSTKPMKWVKDSVETKWVEFQKPKIAVPPR